MLRLIWVALDVVNVVLIAVLARRVATRAGWPWRARFVAAVVLAVLIARAELLLAAALRVVQVLVGPARAPAPRGAAPRIPSPVLVVRIPAHGLRRALPRRGPPVPA